MAKISKVSNSLNDCLHSKPLLFQSLIRVFLRFCLYWVVVLADKKKAFLQVFFQEKDRDFTQFLWIRDPVSVYDVVIYRFWRVAFELTLLPFFLAATIVTHFKNQSSYLSAKTFLNLYVDNVLIINTMFHSGTRIHELHGFNDVSGYAFACCFYLYWLNFRI